ncbi:MAG TPA: SAM-dependent methyltransferase [Steroidobacteraceae bacterium]|jgi:SAM-dependent MidA family methyltransferase
MTSADAVTILPPLSPEEADQSERVLRAVHAAIEAHDGWLAFDDYLRLVLYAPGLGYYSAGSIKFGRGGDFVTAPEISTLFGRCVARQCAQILQPFGGDILELGAGSGALAFDLLSTLDQLGALPQQYYILEISAELRARQRQRLDTLPAALRARVGWLDALPATPMAGVILANEVADALPFKRFVIGAEGAREGGIAWGRGGLIEQDRPAAADLTLAVEQIGRSLADPWSWPAGYQSELCPMMRPWITAIAAALSRGALLLFDYGLARHEYYHPQRTDGTLRCHFRHRAHDDALRYPGMQDISAWVDFTAVAEAASDAGLRVDGYCTQAAFLLASGIEADLAAAANALDRARFASQARQLLLPGEMGEIFKAMALTRGVELDLAGFAHQDLRRSL